MLLVKTTRYIRISIIKKWNLVFTVLEADQSKIEVPAEIVSGESRLPRWSSFHCNLIREKGQSCFLKLLF